MVRSGGSAFYTGGKVIDKDNIKQEAIFKRQREWAVYRFSQYCTCKKYKNGYYGITAYGSVSSYKYNHDDAVIMDTNEGRKPIRLSMERENSIQEKFIHTFVRQIVLWRLYSKKRR